MFTVGLTEGPLALDFHRELYPQAKAMLAGKNFFPAIWSPLATLTVAPFTVFPPTAADVAIGLVGLACTGLALWVVGVRDWRVYGVVALWPQVIGEIRVAHLTPVLGLLLAVAWRYRDSQTRSGLAVGLAGGIKFFLWPVAIWLAATGRLRAVTTAAATGFASLLLVLPYTGLDDYMETLLYISRTFDQDSYTLFGLLTRVGSTDTLARSLTWCAGGILLVLTWRRRSFGLSVAASLVLSPIVWQDYFAVLIVPLAAVRPQLSPTWFLPLATWGVSSSAIATDRLNVVRLLLVFLVVLMVVVRGERLSDPNGGRGFRVVGESAGGRLTSMSRILR